ncbi:uncharacterized protein LOC131849257 [Achroia grisella]|uniref:uncharacterized protein LOC131849257 n=1 Tax=Achroia grisella TaxID=688607 RepID=UPI0027D1F0DB|nr:uncharacterized protein LOC131849257 [Achroia grisella]
MTESNSFSSLQALVDSHLSKTASQSGLSGNTNEATNGLAMPSRNPQTSALSDTLLSLPALPGRLPLPTLSLSESPITQVLKEQVCNMYKAKELRRQQEEDSKLAEKMEHLELQNNKDHIIDLRSALNNNTSVIHSTDTPHRTEEAISNSSSFESLFYPKFSNSDDDDAEANYEITKVNKTPEHILPCTTDMSYILKQKIKTGKCSTFGKVVSARLKPVGAPYLRERVETNIVRFDFKTKSPCDCIKEKLKKPGVFFDMSRND